jgi:hypothetical protein
MDLGFEDIYTETREQIESSITGTYDGYPVKTSLALERVINALLLRSIQYGQ